jgi:AmiR/NasT family two-component response regulator
MARAIAFSARDALAESAEMVETLQALLDIERERADAMKEAVRTARRTGMAVGLVMSHHGLTEDEAFSRLHAASQGAHWQLQENVEAIIAGRRMV